VALGARIMKMKTGTAYVMFYLYAALMGFTLSSIFMVYDLGSIGIALVISAGFFVALTMLALTTKVDMLKAGPILMVALIVLIVSQVILMFFAPSDSTIMVISAVGVLIFAGMTAYDAQRTRALFAQYATNPDMIKRLSIICALSLYLDFVNMFLYLLRLFGGRN
jgi:FtsH-binding integral membrane protein